jgi:hypothetical protein
MRTRQERKSKTRRGRIIATQDVDVAFDDSCIERLAKELPVEADLKVLAVGVREAACIYAREAVAPDANELHDEIANLAAAAQRRNYEEVATGLQRLSPFSRMSLVDRAARLRCELPPHEALLDVGRREVACETIERLCRHGGQAILGRVRPPGKRSRPSPSWRLEGLRYIIGEPDGSPKRSRPSFDPELYAPTARRNFPKRRAERALVIRLWFVWRKATGKSPAPTADDRNPGPFARFVQGCFELIDAKHASAVDLINGLDWEEIERRAGQTGPKVNHASS